MITPDFTYFATAEVVGLLGATPIFVDVDKDYFTILPEDIERAITPRTKAIVPVHLFGQAANMEAIKKIGKAYDIHIIEDCAQSIGCTITEGEFGGKSTGNLGDIGCFSFFPPFFGKCVFFRILRRTPCNIVTAFAISFTQQSDIFVCASAG